MEYIFKWMRGLAIFYPSILPRVLRTPTHLPVPWIDLHAYLIMKYLSILEQFIKNIWRICLVCPVRTRRNEQDRLLACPLGLLDSLRTPNMTIVVPPCS